MVINPSELENVNRDAYYDIDACPTTSTFSPTKNSSTWQQPNLQPCPLPIGVMTDRSIIELIEKATGSDPYGSNNNE